MQSQIKIRTEGIGEKAMIAKSHEQLRDRFTMFQEQLKQKNSAEMVKWLDSMGMRLDQVIEEYKQIDISKQEKAVLSDKTYIGGNKWKFLRETAMEDSYKTQPWYATLSSEDRVLLESLRKAQKEQGDMKKLNLQAIT